MQTATSPARYAVLRVDKRKAKAMGAIAAASSHQMRQKPTPNANAEGPAPIIMHLAAGTTPYQAATAMLDGAERRNCTTVLAREIVLSASAGYFRPGREEHGGEFLAERVKAWANAALEWAKRTWPDQLASFVVHLDEMTPHAHLICVPRERKPDGGWKLNSKKFFDKERLRDLQTSYGEAMAPLGIRRGEPSSRAEHSEVRQFYGALKRRMPEGVRPSAPPPPRAPVEPKGLFPRALTALSDAVGMETELAQERKRYLARRRQWQEQMKEHRKIEQSQWETLIAQSAIAPILRTKPAAQPLPIAPRPLQPATARNERKLGPR